MKTSKLLLSLLTACVVVGCSPKQAPKEVTDLKRALITYKVNFENDKNSMRDFLKAQNDLEIQLQLARSYLSPNQSACFQELVSLSKSYHRLLLIPGRDEQEQTRLFATKSLIGEKAAEASKLLTQQPYGDSRKLILSGCLGVQEECFAGRPGGH